MEKDTSTIDKFMDPSQWMVWKFQVRVNLMASELIGYVDNSIDQPNDATQPNHATLLAEWKKNDAKTQKIIVNSCGSSVLIHICNCLTAREMWTKLHSVYEQSNESAKQLLLEQYHSYKKNPAHDIATHISTLQSMVQKLSAVGAVIDDNGLIMKILMTLPVDYRYFHSAWDSVAIDQKTITNLMNRLMVEESRLGLQSLNLNEVSKSEALMAKQGGASNYKQNKHRQKKEKTKQKGKCFKCGSTEHWKRDCKAFSSDKSKSSSKDGEKGFLGSVSPALNESEAWYQDSGATSHMSNRRDWFVDYMELPKPIDVLLGNGEYMRAIGQGYMNAVVYDGEQWKEKIMHNVLYAPKLCTNLFSSTKAYDRGHKSKCDKDNFLLYDDDKLVAVGVRKGNLYQMMIKIIGTTHEKSMVNIATESNSLRVWHERLGHQNLAHVRKFLKNNSIDFKDENFDCDGCAFGKQHRLSFDLRPERATKCGEIVHADVCGPIEEKSFGGSRYFVLFKDDFSHFRFVYFLENKSEVPEKVKVFVNMAEKQFGHPIKILQTDNGGEFVNATVKAFTEQKGIHHRRSVAYTPEQNGCVERENRTIMEAARSMIHAKNLNPKLWAEAAHSAVYILNRTGTSTLKDVTPYELWYGKKAQFEHFRIFGSEVYVHIPKQNRRKLDAKAKKCLFIGYDDNKKGFRVIDESNSISVARDVKFLTEEPSKITIIECNDENLSSDEKEPGALSDQNDVQQQQKSNKRIGMNSQGIDNNNIISSRLRNRTPETAMMGVALMAISDEPKTFDEAINSHDGQLWKNAMDSEYNSLVANQTWTLVKRPNNQRIVDNKWIFKVKENPDGSIVRHKARLVARGFTQEYGIDYIETFSPVVRFDSLRAILAVAAEKEMHMKQFDVKTAFLNGDLKETVYMHQPIGYDDNSGRVCKLQKSLYGLKQASRCWNQKFKSFMERFGFKASDSDPCVFVSHKNRNTLILAIYVDDGLVVGDDKKNIDLVIEQLKREFEMTVMDVNCFLGFEIEKRENGTFIMHQTAYAKKVLRKFRMDECNPVSIPSDPNQTLSKFCDSEVSNFPYRQLIGSLMYLSIATRPDISYAIGNVSRYMENPTVVHERALKRILKYVAGTVSHGIQFNKNGNHRLIGFSDADYAGNVDTRKSTSGFVFLYNNSIISWCSSLQQCVSVSTTESEYVAASEAVKELVWLKRLFGELLPGSDNDVSFFMDNEGAIRLTKNPEFHKRTKHIDVRYHFIRENYEKGYFDLHHVSTNEMMADLFTKALPRVRFEYLRTSIGIISND